jgi:exonuclease VII small subunit
MKKNACLIVAIALVGTVALTLNTLRAQEAPPPGGPPPAQMPPPGQMPPPNMRPGGPPGGLRGRPPGSSYRQAVQVLRRVKMDLERSKDDYNGHRQSAMDACDKAMQELQAVQESIEAARAAAAKAAAEQQQNAPPPPAAAPAPAPAPAPPQ